MATEIASADNDAVKVATRDRGQKGLTGDDGLDGAGFNQVRQSLLDSPLCRLFTPNAIVDTLAGTLTATRSTTATYVDRYGVVKSAAIDEMREESAGWLIEDDATNSMLYSEQLDNAAWPTVDATVQANVATAPDGTLTADNVYPSSTGAGRYIRQGYTYTSGQIYTISGFAKANGKSVISSVGSSAVWGSPLTAYWDLANETVSIVGASIINATLYSLGNGYYRFSVTAESVLNGVNGFGIAIAITDASGSSAVTANGTDGVLLWGMQIELGGVATSYIPTTGTAVTRAADLIKAQALDNTPLLSSAFSVTCTVKAKIPAQPTLAYLFSFDNGVATNTGQIFSLLRGTGNEFLSRYSDGSVNVDGSISITEGDDYFVAIVFDGAAIATTVNSVSSGGGAVSNLSATDTASSLFLGSNASESSQLNSNIKDFRVYDFALNADEVEYLTGVK